MVKYCKNCGSKINEDSVFCDECGTKVDGNPSLSNSIFPSHNVDMMDGEVVIRQSQIHSGCLIPPAIVFGLGIFIGFVIFIRLLAWRYYINASVFSLFFNGLTIFGLIWFVIRFIAYKTNDLILTNKRVFGKCGLISTTQMQSPLNKIDSVSFSNRIIGKLIGYGTVKIATTSSTFKFRFIREGQTFYNDIFNQVEVSQEESRNLNAKAIVDAMAEKLGE